MLYSSLKARLCSPLCSVQFLIPPYLMTPLTNYNSGSHLFYGWAPKTFHFLVLQNSFFYSLTWPWLAVCGHFLVICKSFFSHSVTDSLHKPLFCVISIILKNGYSPHWIGGGATPRERGRGGAERPLSFITACIFGCLSPLQNQKNIFLFKVHSSW